MQLAIPVNWNGIEIIECEIQRPDSGTLARTTKARHEQTIIHAMQEYITGGVEKYIDPIGKEYTEKKDIKSITENLPLQTAEHLSMRIMAQLYPGEYIQGIYECPVSGCNGVIKISQKNENSISYDDLNVEYINNKDIDFSLRDPVFLRNKKTGEQLMGGQELSLSIPKLKDYRSGIRKYPRNPNYQYYDMILNCLKTIDGNTIEPKLLASWGMTWIDKVDGEDTQEILDLMALGGIDKKINLTCPKCMEEFSGNIDITSFFVSGLSRK